MLKNFTILRSEIYIYIYLTYKLLICLQKGCRNPVHLNMYMPCINRTNHFYFWPLILHCSNLLLFRFLNFIPYTLLWIVAIYTRVFHFPVYIGCIYSLNRYCILVRPSDFIIILISWVHFFIILFFFFWNEEKGLLYTRNVRNRDFNKMCFQRL